MVLNNGKSTSEIAYEIAKRKIEALEQLLQRRQRVDEGAESVSDKSANSEVVEQNGAREMVCI